MHILSYILETDDNVSLEYVLEEYEPYFQPEWEHGFNEFNDIGDVDPYSVDSPYMVRIDDGNNQYSYYTKTVIVPWKGASVRISVLIDGVEGNPSFRYEGYNGYIKTKKVGSEIYATISSNDDDEYREGNITVTHSSDKNAVTNVKIRQIGCDFNIGFLSCIINNGVNPPFETLPETSDVFEYTFNKLTAINEPNKQSISLSVMVNGVSNRFFIKNIDEYTCIGEIDDTYTYINGKYYKDMPKWVNGEYVTSRIEVMVVDNMVYYPQKYDNVFEINTNGSDLLTITNYGRVYMPDKVMYIITLSNYDKITNTCQLVLRYSEV